jgi:hypothetical protein
VRGLQRDPEAAALLRIASRAITEAPAADLREWAEGSMDRSHRQLAARLRPALPGLDDRELAFRVFCAGGIANRFHTAASLPRPPPRRPPTSNGCWSPPSRACSPAPGTAGERGHR